MFVCHYVWMSEFSPHWVEKIERNSAVVVARYWGRRTGPRPKRSPMLTVHRPPNTTGRSALCCRHLRALYCPRNETTILRQPVLASALSHLKPQQCPSILNLNSATFIATLWKDAKSCASGVVTFLKLKTNHISLLSLVVTSSVLHQAFPVLSQMFFTSFLVDVAFVKQNFLHVERSARWVVVN